MCDFIENFNGTNYPDSDHEYDATDMDDMMGEALNDMIDLCHKLVDKDKEMLTLCERSNKPYWKSNALNEMLNEFLTKSRNPISTIDLLLGPSK